MAARLRVGITGCGLIGGTHARAIMESELATVAGLYDTDRSRAEALSRTIGTNQKASEAPLVADSFASLLQVGLDAVFICLPPFAHDGEVATASQAGVHVFMEKPIALTSDLARKTSEAAEAAGIVNQVGYMMRFSEAVGMLDKLIEDGTAGQPMMFQADYSCNSLHSPWWRDRSKSGGQLFEQAIHLYDLALHFLGKPAGVSCVTNNLGHDQDPLYTIEDTSSAIVRFESGSLASVSASNCGIPGRWDHRFKLICKNAVAVVENGTHMSITRHDGSELESSEEFDFSDDAIASEDVAFLECVQSGRQSPVPLRVGYHGVKLVEAAVRSQGRWMDLS